MGRNLLVRSLSCNPFGDSKFSVLLTPLLFFVAIHSDVIGVVQSVSPTMSIRRKSNNDNIPKRDITIADKR